MQHEKQALTTSQTFINSTSTEAACKSPASISATANTPPSGRSRGINRARRNPAS